MAARAMDAVDTSPHPGPLPASGARERRAEVGICRSGPPPRKRWVTGDAFPCIDRFRGRGLPLRQDRRFDHGG
jgi:hypothetical protein